MKKIIACGLFLGYMIAFLSINGAEKPHYPYLPLQLLLSPEYQNSIVVCGVKARPCPEIAKRFTLESDLLMFAKDSIDLYRKTIEEKKLTVLIFGNLEENCWRNEKCNQTAFVYKKRIKDRKLLGRMQTYVQRRAHNLIDDKSLVVYNMPFCPSEKNTFNEVYINELPYALRWKKAPCLILVDDALQLESIMPKLYERFNAKKRIVACNPYTGTVEDYCLPGNNFILCPLLACCAVGYLIYHNPEIGYYLIESLKWGSMMR